MKSACLANIGRKSAVIALIALIAQLLGVVTTTEAHMPPDRMTWAGFLIVEDKYVYADPFMGWLNIHEAPWVWCEGTHCYYYMTEDVVFYRQGWVYLTAPGNLDFYPIPNAGELYDGWGWSFKLSKWMFVPDDVWDTGSGWALMAH